MAESHAVIKDQPLPQRTDGAPVWDLVLADMRERDRLGRERYGTPLQAFNGRDALVDAYQEALDLAVYLRQAIEEREQPRITGRDRARSRLVAIWFALAPAATGAVSAAIAADATALLVGCACSALLMLSGYALSWGDP